MMIISIKTSRKKNKVKKYSKNNWRIPRAVSRRKKIKNMGEWLMYFFIFARVAIIIRLPDESAEKFSSVQYAYKTKF